MGTAYNVSDHRSQLQLAKGVPLVSATCTLCTSALPPALSGILTITCRGGSARQHTRGYQQRAVLGRSNFRLPCPHRWTCPETMCPLLLAPSAVGHLDGCVCRC